MNTMNRRYRAALLAAALLAAPATAQTVEKHANTPAGLILQSVTVKPGATTLYLSGQLAAPLDPAKKVPPAQLTIADFGDTKTQTISVLN
jgi:2-iminobutanoate/2-iminopropanoate deaminase